MKKLLLSLAIVLALCGCSNKTEERAQIIETENTATDNTENINTENQSFAFNAVTLEGEDFNQDNIFEKDVTVINFWSTWCGPCVEEMPELAQYEKALPDNVQLITVCFDGGEVPEEAKAILEQAGFEGKTLIAMDGSLYDIATTVEYTPTTVFLDSKGNSDDNIIIGAGDIQGKYTEAINSLLNKQGKESISLE